MEVGRTMTDLEFAAEAARAAGQLLMERHTVPLKVREKGYRDIVSDADIASQTLIAESLRSRFRHHLIWSEESARPASLDGPIWIVDPLDGTSNYIHGIPIYAVTLALLEGSEVQAGVVYAPVFDQMFTAERGRGAWMNGQPIRVSSEEDVASAVLGCDWARSPEDRIESLRVVYAIGEHVRTLRSIGAGALALCHVAAGCLDAQFGMSLWPWDVLAASLCLTEAGGRISDLRDTPDPWGSRAIIASNAHLHDPLLRLARSALVAH